MKNLRILNQNNLIKNLSRFKHKKICAMVKANAYGHGLEDIVKMSNPYVDCFGVVNIQEALDVRRLSSKPIFICAKIEDFKICRDHNFCVLIEDELDLKRAIEFGCKMFLKINCGMNRYGAKEKLQIKKINNILEENKTKLEAICTHFSDTENEETTNEEYLRFVELRNLISQQTDICFGGSNIVRYSFPCDMIRVGISMYGYGDNVRPVEKVVSYVAKVFCVQKGESIGYSGKFISEKGGIYAVVPVGYGDGLRRNLSGRFDVKINNKRYRSVGNICMDAFFVEIDNGVKVGDEVVVMDNAEELAKDTICYEVLTGFSSFRGETMIE